MKNNNGNTFEAIIALIVFIAIGVGLFFLIDWMNTPKEHEYGEWDRAYVQKRNESQTKEKFFQSNRNNLISSNNHWRRWA